MVDPVNAFWVVVGVLLWPEMTLCVILWMLGHPFLGIFALLFAETTKTNVKTVVRDRLVDSRTGKVISG
jgi:hypothetical protein